MADTVTVDLEPASKEEQEQVLLEVMNALSDVVRKHNIKPEMIWENAGTQMIMRVPIPRLKHTDVTKVREA